MTFLGFFKLKVQSFYVKFVLKAWMK